MLKNLLSVDDTSDILFIPLPTALPPAGRIKTTIITNDISIALLIFCVLRSQYKKYSVTTREPIKAIFINDASVENKHMPAMAR